MSKQGSTVHTEVVEAVAIEAGVDKSSITMTTTPMTKTSPSVLDELSLDDNNNVKTKDDADMTIIIIASAAGGGGGIILAVIGMLIFRYTKQKQTKQKQRDTTKNVEMAVVQLEVEL